MNRYRLVTRTRLASVALVAVVGLVGCHGSSTTSAQFSASTTAPSPGLIKLVPKSRSGSRVVVDALIYGPEPDLDLNAFRFGVRIGDTTLVRLAVQTSYLQSALVPANGQTVVVDVDGASDPSVVRVDVEKQGGGAGNGVPGASAVVVELSFDVLGSGATTLTLVGAGLDAPVALDSAGGPIAGVTFDAESASVRGVTTGGGGY